MDYVAEELRSNGPFDVIFAFFEGAAQALSTLLHRKADLKCLVLVVPFPPFDTSGGKRLDTFLCKGPLVYVPTVFIYG